MRLAAIARNPIYEREFTAFCRTKRWFVLRTALVVLLAMVLWSFLGVARGDGPDLDVIGRMLFGAAAFAQVGFVFLIAPAMVADLIVGERRRNSLDLLLTTPLSPWSVVAGKLLSRLSLLSVMLVAAFPVISVSLLYGGVRGSQVAGLLAVTLGTALFASGPAILLSSFARRLGTAAALSYVLPFALLVLAPILAFELIESEDAAYALLAHTHFLVATIHVTSGDLLPVTGLGMPPSLFFLLANAAFLGICTSGAVLRLRAERRGAAAGIVRPGREERARSRVLAVRRQLQRSLALAPEGPERARIAACDGAVAASLRRLEGKGDPSPDGVRTRLGRTRVSVVAELRALEQRLAELGYGEASNIGRAVRSARAGPRRRVYGRMKNPMLWKELNLVNSTHSRVLFFVALGLIVLGEAVFALLLPASVIAEEAAAHVTLLSCQCFVLFLVLAMNGATSVVAEREARTLELVNVTLLPTGQITFAKTLGALRSVALLALVPVAHAFVYSAVSELRPAGAVGFTLALGLFLVFLAALSVRISVSARSPARAVVLTMAVLAGLLVGIPMFLGFFALFSAGTAYGLYEFLMFSQPFMTVQFPLLYLSGTEADEARLFVMCLVWLLIYGLAALFLSLRMPQAYRRSFDRK